MGLVPKQLRVESVSDIESEDESGPEVEKGFKVRSVSKRRVDDSGTNSEVESEPEREMEEDVEEDEKEEEEQVENGHQMDDEMEELEKEYQSLRHKEQDLLKSLKQHKDEDLLKGQAVKNQKALWDKTLELRFLLQKAFSSSNKLPQEPLRSSLLDSHEEVNVAYSDLIHSSEQTLECLLELQEALLEKNPSVAQETDGKPSKYLMGPEASQTSNEEVDKEWLRIYQMHSRIAPFRNSSIDKWQRKTQVTTGAAAIKGKLHAFNQNISEQVAVYMKDPSRLIKRMQLKRSAVGIFGADPDMVDDIKDGNVDGDAELLDDSEFYQQLLKEFFETFDLTSSETALYALKRAQTKKRKIVDRRASKSRKIRYNVHEKMVNFMAPQPMDLPPMAPKLFENLFGLKTQKPSSAVA